jgi:hypothetical protein
MPNQEKDLLLLAILLTLNKKIIIMKKLQNFKLIILTILSTLTAYSANSHIENFPKEKPKKSKTESKIIPVSDVAHAKRRLPESSYSEITKLLFNGKIEAIPLGHQEEKYVYTRIHPMIGALHYGFAHHRPVSISPDMMWMMILQGFAEHISFNIDSLSPLLFKDTSKVNIEIRRDEFIRGSAENDWSTVFPEFSEEISNQTLPNVHPLFSQSFSTTNTNISACYTITMMDAFSEKFNFNVMTACGIPYIVLEGSPSDWKWILENLPKLKKYGCNDWIESLELVIEEIYKSSKGEINSDFWKSIYKWQDGSGGSVVTGWIIKFFPYLENSYGEKIKNPYLNIDYSKDEDEHMYEGMRGDNFSSGLSSCDFTWNYYGKEIPMVFCGGFIGISQDENLVLKPEINWFIAEKFTNYKPNNDSISDFVYWEEGIYRFGKEIDFIYAREEPSPSLFYEICENPDTYPIFDPDNNLSYEDGLAQFIIAVSEMGLVYSKNEKVNATLLILPDGTCDCDMRKATDNFLESMACNRMKYVLNDLEMKWKPATKDGQPVMVKQQIEVQFESYE